MSGEPPVLLYDGECEFCRLWIARWRRATGDRVRYASYQEEGSRFPGIPAGRLARAVHLLEPDGRWSSGAEAVFRALARAPGRAWPLWLYRRAPGFRPASEWFYRLVAEHRPAFTRLTRWLWGAGVVPAGHALTSWIYVRALALVYLAAFVSLWTQVRGLIGSRGILPASEYLQAAQARDGALCYWFSPTLAWIGSSDGFLAALCAAGVVLSVLLVLGAMPIACLLGLWTLYLSLTTVGQEFFWFQWDSLLLEAGLLSVFLAPWRRWSWPQGDPEPSTAARWLLRWLLFRLFVSSAAVKLLSGDPTWRDLTALQYHFETQPLPPWTAWYADHLPAWALRAATASTLAIEGIVPFLMLGPRRVRLAAAALMGSLQVLILATGNYAFFNWLTLALCLMLLDDGVWPRRWREAGAARPAEARAAGMGAAPAAEGGRWLAWILRPVAAMFFLLGLAAFLRGTGRPTGWLGPVSVLSETIRPFRSANHYGLFAVMTTERSEIVLEGSEDGATWRPYEFRYKPGDVMRRPAFVAPFQPRLDWQMWFAALADYRQSPWFLRFCQRLLEGSRPVSALLESDPFPGSPPRYLRAKTYDYRFAGPAERHETGAWWRRRELGPYAPVLALRGDAPGSVPRGAP